METFTIRQTPEQRNVTQRPVDYRDIVIADQASEIVALRRCVDDFLNAFLETADYLACLQRTFHQFLTTLDEARRDAQAERDRVLAAREVEAA